MHVLIACLLVPDLSLVAWPGNNFEQISEPMEARDEYGWIRSSMDTLREVALSFSPRVGSLKQGSLNGLEYGYVCMDAGGLWRLYGDEKRLGRSMVRMAESVGLDTRVGFAHGVEVARFAALRATDKEPVCVVARGDERIFLAPLPVELLSLSGHLGKMLARFGISTMGQLASLPEKGLKLRLGPEGMRAWRLSRGESLDPFVAERPEEMFVEHADAAWAMGGMEQVLSQLEHVFVRLAERLRCRALVARALVVTLELESGHRWDREVKPATPCVDVKVWLDAVRLVIQSQPPESAVEAVEVRALVMPGRVGQGDLFRKTGFAASRELDEVLARLGSLSIRRGVGSPRLLDTHMPDPVENVSVGKGGAEFVVSPDCHVAIRRFRPPVRVEVILDGDRPVSMNAPFFEGRIKRAAGPWRLDWGWWQRRSFKRDYYDVELDGGGLYRIFFDGEHSRWYADGVLG